MEKFLKDDGWSESQGRDRAGGKKTLAVFPVATRSRLAFCIALQEMDSNGPRQVPRDTILRTWKPLAAMAGKGFAL